MTDAELEPAARRLCAIRGLDPDGWTRNEHGWASCAWIDCIPEIRAHLEREQALVETRAEAQREAFEKTWKP